MLKTTAFLLGCLLTLANARAACQVDPKATVPLTVAPNGAITVTVKANGTPGTFILDTGAQRSVVTPDGVKHLGLARDTWVDTTMQGVGGIERRANADTRSFTLGGVPLARNTLNHDTSLTVATLPLLMPNGSSIDGLLGRDYLSAFDLDMNLPGRSLKLYHVEGCGGRFLPWIDRYNAVPVDVLPDHALIVPVTLDGHKLRALLDSGASSSVLAAPGMFRMGLKVRGLAADPAAVTRGLGARGVTMHRHTFTSLRIGTQVVAAPVIYVAPIRLLPIVDMLLGADWLTGREVWISYATRQLFVRSP